MPGVNPISSGGPSSAAANDSETTALLHEASTSGTLDVHKLATEVSKLTPAQQKAVTGELQGRLSPMQLGQFARLQGEAASHAAFTSKQGEHPTDLACRISRQLDEWSKDDLNTAVGTAGAGQFGKSMSGKLAVRAGKGLLGVSEVFGATALVEGAGSAVINGLKTGDFTEGATVAAQKLGSVAAGVEGLGGATADKINDHLIRQAGLRTPCD